MNPYEDNKLKTYILTSFNQISIFSIYLDIPEDNIEYCLENESNKINNPLRVDNNPSLGFRIVLDKETGENKIKMYDFANSFYRGDCFDLVGIVQKYGRIDKNVFITICKDIIYTMQNRVAEQTLRKVEPYIEKVDDFKIFTYDARLWNTNDITFWHSWGFHFSEIKTQIIPINKGFINGVTIYKYNEFDPCYAYISGFYKFRTLVSFYFPLRKKSSGRPKFMKNNKYYPLEGIHEMKKADILIITKSYKDRLLLKKMFSKIEIKYTIEITNLVSESLMPTDEFIEKLFGIYTYIISNTDFDKEGLRISGKLKRKHYIPRYILTNGRFGTFDFGGKDISDVVKNKGFEYALELVKTAYNHFTETINNN